MEEFRIYKGLDEFIEAMEKSSNSKEVDLEIICDKKRGVIILTDPDGLSAEVPISHFKEIIKKCDQPCLSCGGELNLAVLFELEEVLFLGCDSCDSYYTVRNNELYALERNEDPDYH